jgi:hypothetical protein
MRDAQLDRAIAEAVLGLDTLWGGDVLAASGTGRLIADSWFSDQPLPGAYSHPAAARLRANGGVSAEQPDAGAVDRFLEAVDVAGAIALVRGQAVRLGGLRGAFLGNLGESLQVVWELAMEVLERGERVPYERCVHAATGGMAQPSDPAPLREALTALLLRAGCLGPGETVTTEGVERWRAQRMVPPETLDASLRALTTELDALCKRNILPYLPKELLWVPRANVSFEIIPDAFFSGAMTYLGRARRADGQPEYEARCEINGSLEISAPELVEFVSHEVVPGHVTSLAYLQALYVQGVVGFEATVQVLSGRCCTLLEGIANNGALLVHGVTEIDELPDDDLKVAMILARLQDAAKNQAAYLTWSQDAQSADVAAELRRDYLLTEERAEKLSGPWSRHPLLGRMNMAMYQAGTELVEQLRRRYPPEQLLPALYGCRGVVDCTTIRQALPQQR